MNAQFQWDQAVGGIFQAQEALDKLIAGAKGTEIEKDLPALMSARAKLRKAEEALHGINALNGEEAA